MGDDTRDTMPETDREAALTLLSEQARARWGEDYLRKNRALLELSAQYMVSVAGNLPDAETEPGFYQ